MKQDNAALLRKLEDEAERRQDNTRPPIDHDNLLVVGGQKIDLSRPTEGYTDAQLKRRFPRLVAAGGKVYDLDSRDPNTGIPKEVDLKDSYVIDNRVLVVGSFGGDGAGIVLELYHQFLSAVQQGQESTFRAEDGTHKIPDYLRNGHCRRMIQERLNFKDGCREQFVSWKDLGAATDPDSTPVTFENWMHWSAATIRWKIHYELPLRLERQMDIYLRDTMQSAKALMESSLIAIEKWIALPLAKKTV